MMHGRATRPVSILSIATRYKTTRLSLPDCKDNTHKQEVSSLQFINYELSFIENAHSIKLLLKTAVLAHLRLSTKITSPRSEGGPLIGCPL